MDLYMCKAHEEDQGLTVIIMSSQRKNMTYDRGITKILNNKYLAVKTLSVYRKILGSSPTFATYPLHKKIKIKTNIY